ncbi:MAG: hypothetical protein WAM85_19950 [Terracidiphilus sp.]
MRMFVLIAALLIALSSRAETLRDVLKSNGIPEVSFSKVDLDENVNGAAANEEAYVLVVYVRVIGDLLTGYPQLVRYDRHSGAIRRSEIKPEDEDKCCGSPNSIEFIGDFAILSFHINPSASAMMVLGKELNLVTTLYGFDVHEVAPDQIVFIENMIHFAPAHPERLQFADLRSGKKTELYPPKGDVLRAEFAREHAKHMPPQATCEKFNDPCEPELYDEDIDFLGVDGHGTFVFTVHRDASHATEEGQPPDSVASEAALYRYTGNSNAWFYCEEKLSEDEARALGGPRGHNGSTIKDRCTPTLPVEPDMSNSDYSPFE